MRDLLNLQEENNPSPLAPPYPLPSERAVINGWLTVSPNVQTRGTGVPPVHTGKMAVLLKTLSDS